MSAYDNSDDYTAGDNIPGVGPEDPMQMAIPEMDLRPVDEIEAEYQFHDIPPGEWALKVTKVVDVKPKIRSVTVDGRVMSYTSALVILQFGLPDSPNTTVQDSFVFPPSNKLEQVAYTRGCTVPDNPNGKPGKPGFDANKYQQFIQRLHKATPIKSIADLVGADVIATVNPAENYEQNGVEKKGYPKVKLFSYRSITDPNPPAGPAQAKGSEKKSAASIPTRNTAPGQQSLPLAATTAAVASGIGAI